MQIVPLDLYNLGYAVALAKEMHGLSTFSVDGPDFDWDYTYSNMRSTIGMRDYYFMLAQDDGYSYCGAVCGHVIPYYFSPKLQGVEEAWYVREGTAHRAKIACALMHGFVDWCINERAALMVQSGDIAAINSLAVDTLYKKLGFRRYGSAYKYTRVEQ
jgi:hypothetical protein